MNKKQLSRPSQWVIGQCQKINFGRITFQVRGGEPDLGQLWCTRRTIKLTNGENGPRPEANLADFKLCHEQTALLNVLSGVRDDARVTVEVRHGLPFLVEIERDHQVA